MPVQLKDQNIQETIFRKAKEVLLSLEKEPLAWEYADIILATAKFLYCAEERLAFRKKYSSVPNTASEAKAMMEQPIIHHEAMAQAD